MEGNRIHPPAPLNLTDKHVTSPLFNLYKNQCKKRQFAEGIASWTISWPGPATSWSFSAGCLGTAQSQETVWHITPGKSELSFLHFSFRTVFNKQDKTC